MYKKFLDDFEIDMFEVRKHYLLRKQASDKLKQLLAGKKINDYVELAIGYSDRFGNFSSHEHGLGEKILANNSHQAIFKFAEKLKSNGLLISDLPSVIRKENLPYIKISVGSEMACMLNPNKFWVGNVRTIWSHLVIKHEGDWEKANEEHQLYQFDDISSEMHYKIWQQIYTSMKENLDIIYEISLNWAKDQGVKPGRKKYLWIDVICSHLYECE